MMTYGQGRRVQDKPSPETATMGCGNHDHGKFCPGSADARPEGYSRMVGLYGERRGNRQGEPDGCQSAQPRRVDDWSVYVPLFIAYVSVDGANIDGPRGCSSSE